MNPSERTGNCEICGSPASLFPGNLRNTDVNEKRCVHDEENPDC